MYMHLYERYKSAPHGGVRHLVVKYVIVICKKSWVRF
jgi:hypothetical protein